MSSHRAPILSILALGAASLFTGQASAQQIGTPAPIYDQVLRAIAACGVPAASVGITYVEELQSDLVRIGDLGGSDEARFRCLRKAVHPYYILDVSAASQRDSYFAFDDREDRREAKGQALSWLRARGMLATVPHYYPGKGLTRFARALEAACAIPKGGVLEAVGSSGLTFRRSFMEKLSFDASGQFECLNHMTAASNADKHDVRLILLGNAAY